MTRNIKESLSFEEYKSLCWFMNNDSDYFAIQYFHKKDQISKYAKTKYPLSDSIINEAFNDFKTIGFYANNGNDYTRWACWDIDNHNGEDKDKVFEKANHFFENACDSGHPVLFEKSSGGYHIFIFHDKMESCEEIRSKYADTCEGVEFFPKSKTKFPLVRAPFSVHIDTKRKSKLIEFYNKKLFFEEYASDLSKYFENKTQEKSELYSRYCLPYHLSEKGFRHNECLKIINNLIKHNISKDTTIELMSKYYNLNKEYINSTPEVHIEECESIYNWSKENFHLTPQEFMWNMSEYKLIEKQTTKKRRQAIYEMIRFQKTNLKATSKKDFFVSYEIIGNILNCSKVTAGVFINQLIEEKILIMIKKGHTGMASEYKFMLPENEHEFISEQKINNELNVLFPTNIINNTLHTRVYTQEREALCVK